MQISIQIGLILTANQQSSSMMGVFNSIGKFWGEKFAY